MTDGAERIGIVGGTFDPIHLGHVELAEAARRCARLDRVLLIPAGVPPHRHRPVASDADRLAMCRLAVRHHPNLEASDRELRRGGPSYTLQTLVELQRAYPGAGLFLVLGWDAARDLPTWHEPQQVLRLATLVVLPRPGLAPPTAADLREAGVDPARTLLCRPGTPDVGATDLRRRLRSGAEPDGLLDPAVLAYIREHHLYEETD
ncbi:MAG: nicotinate (nicotinamide) nucleotide adenylyltransferase [Candidatus Dormiibacterota bacterium]